jgi:hypothetical protein
VASLFSHFLTNFQYPSIHGVATGLEDFQADFYRLRMCAGDHAIPGDRLRPVKGKRRRQFSCSNSLSRHHDQHQNDR